jgi:hypothetical protein
MNEAFSPSSSVSRGFGPRILIPYRFQESRFPCPSRPDDQKAFAGPNSFGELIVECRNASPGVFRIVSPLIAIRIKAERQGVPGATKNAIEPTNDGHDCLLAFLSQSELYQFIHETVV